MGKDFNHLVDIVRQLRSPQGCPWDREQTHKSILSCLLEETYEFFEAVDENDTYKMKEELGDLLLQIVLHSQIASENDRFNIEDVAREINEKLIRRHPHVFGDTEVSNSSEVINNWEKIKKKEKGKEDRKSLVDAIPEALPALFRAEKIQRRVTRAGFDWKSAPPVFDKVEEEFDEFREAYMKGETDHAEEELGDILFSLVNVARHSGISAENALRKTINKFENRFRYIEDKLKKEGQTVQSSTLERMEYYWQKSKKHY